jgi:hypothetical protein
LPPDEGALARGTPSPDEPDEDETEDAHEVAVHAGAAPRPEIRATRSLWRGIASGAPVLAFFDEHGQLVVGPGGSGDPLGRPAGSAGVTQASKAAARAPAHVEVAPDGKGGAFIQVTIHMRAPGSGRDESGGADPGSVDPPIQKGKVLDPTTMPWDSHGGWLHPFGFTGPEAGPTLPGRGPGSKDKKGGPVHHSLCAEYSPSSIRVLAGAGGTIELVADDEGEAAILALIDVTGVIVQTGEGVTMCDTPDGPFVTFDG